VCPVQQIWSVFSVAKNSETVDSTCRALQVAVLKSSVKMDKSLASWLEGQAMEFSASRCFQRGKSFGCRQSSDASQCGWILLVSIIARHGSVLSTVNPYCSNWVRQRVTYRATLTTGCFRCLQQSLRSKAAFWRPRSPRPSETCIF
jgi:hypothetical protein